MSTWATQESIWGFLENACLTKIYVLSAHHVPGIMINIRWLVQRY